MNIEDITPKKNSRDIEVLIEKLNIPPDEIIRAEEFNAIVNEVKDLKLNKEVSAFNFKENVPTYADLPTDGNEVNDGYGVIADGLVYVWNGTAFPPEGDGMDLGLRPNGVIEENNVLAVSGGEVFGALKKNTIDVTFTYKQAYVSIDTGLFLESVSANTSTLEFQVEKGVDYYASGYVGASLVSALATYFDKDGNYLGSQYESTGENTYLEDVPLSLPTSTSIVRLLSNNNYGISKLTTSYKNIYLNSKEIHNIIDISSHVEAVAFFPKKYIDETSGQWVDSSNFDTYTAEFQLDNSFDYYATGIVGGNTSTVLATYFDKDGNYLGSEYKSAGTYLRYIKAKLTPPLDAFKVRLLGSYINNKAGLIKKSKDNIPDSDIFFPQIKNNPLPKKTPGQKLRVLCFGSSWFMDTWWYLNKITYSAGLDVEFKCFYSGGAKFQLWIDAYNNNSNVGCWSSSNGADWTNAPTNFKNTLAEKWDLIVFQQGARQSRWWTDWENWSDLVRIVKINSGVNTSIAFNSTWTPAQSNVVEMAPYAANQSGQRQWQEGNYNFCKKFLKLSGIDLVVPNGALIWALRGTDMNNENDLATDGLHPDNGLPVYALSANFYQTLIAPIYGLDISTVEWLPDENTQKAPVSGSSFMPIDSLQRLRICELIKIAQADRFGFRTE